MTDASSSTFRTTSANKEGEDAMTGSLVRTCNEDGCDTSFPDHRWGATKAHNDGWFIGRNQTWCLNHQPEWVAAWRARHSDKDPDDE